MIKSFRGLLADDDQRTIRLGTNNGLTGYRIVKFQLMLNDPSADNTENTVQIWNHPQSTLSNQIDFDNSELLASGYIENSDSHNQIGYETIIFDSEVFNQDIYVTNVAGAGQASTGINYYLELEQVKLDVGEAAVATLKDMRGSN